MDLQDFRRELDEIDTELLRLFCRRMAIVEEIGAYKIKNGLQVTDPERERRIFSRIAQESPEGLEDDAAALYTTILELSRAKQERIRAEQGALEKKEKVCCEEGIEK
jgi:chorismate mutase